MILYVMRHADAGKFRGNPILDSKRALTKEGKDQCMLMAHALTALKVHPDVVVSSPIKRALQTAQFVGTELGYEAKVEISQALAPGASFLEFQAMMAAYTGRDAVMVVGHNPNVYRFLGQLIAGPDGAAIRMRKSSIACVDMTHHPPRLQWLLDVRTARGLYANVAKSSRAKTSRK
jgi:phosphohistidine phosphatase